MIRTGILLIVCLAVLALYAPSVIAGYGDGGGSGNVAIGSTAPSGATVSSTLTSRYAPYSAGVTDIKSLQTSADRYNAGLKESIERPSWRNERQMDMPSGWYQLQVSAAAWNGKNDVRVQRLAYVLEAMMIDGALPPNRAWQLLVIYTAGLEMQKDRQGR